MTDVRVLIRESYDSRPTSEVLDWSSIVARTPARSRRRLRWPLAMIAFVLAAGAAVATGGTDANRLPPTDFDVALAPNWDGEGNLIDRSTDRDGNGQPTGALLPGVSFRINGDLRCLFTPGSDSGAYLSFEQIGDFRSLTEQDFIDGCVRNFYHTDWYAETLLGPATVTANELRGVDSDKPAIPDVFALCVDGTDTASVVVIPGFEGITDLSHACQDNALHPLDFNGEKRERFMVSDWPEYHAWRERQHHVEYEYPGFAHFD